MIYEVKKYEAVCEFCGEKKSFEGSSYPVPLPEYYQHTKNLKIWCGRCAIDEEIKRVYIRKDGSRWTAP